MSKAKPKRTGPKKPRSAAQIASAQRLAESNRARREAKHAPVEEIPGIGVGDRVRIRPTKLHPKIVRGTVLSVEGPVITVAQTDGFTVRHREHQLVKLT